MNPAFALYAIGFLVMLAPLVTERVDGLSAFAVFLVGIAVFLLGFAMEEGSHRR